MITIGPFICFQSFKSKQLVRSQAIRETHSPPRALSPAQPTTPTVAISATSVANSTPSVGNSSPSVGNTAPSVGNAASHVGNAATNIENGTNDAGNVTSNITTLPCVGNSPPSVGSSPPSVEKASNERTVSVSEDSSHVSVRCSDVVNSSDVKHSDRDDFKKKQPVEIQVSVLFIDYYLFICCFLQGSKNYLGPNNSIFFTRNFCYYWTIFIEMSSVLTCLDLRVIHFPEP